MRQGFGGSDPRQVSLAWRGYPQFAKARPRRIGNGITCGKRRSLVPTKKSVEVVLVAKKKCGETPQGTVIRWKTKDIDREWMIGQLYRTRARLWPEADLRAERRALGLALVMLDAL